MNTNKSEVALLRERIEQEHKAACFAMGAPQLGAAKHKFITRRMERIDAQRERLAELVGEDASIAFVMEVMEQTPEKEAL